MTTLDMSDEEREMLLGILNKFADATRPNLDETPDLERHLDICIAGCALHIGYLIGVQIHLGFDQEGEHLWEQLKEFVVENAQAGMDLKLEELGGPRPPTIQ